MKDKIKIYLDYLPFSILLVSAIILIRTVLTTNILLVTKHYIGFVFLIITAIFFFARHLYGVFFLGFTLFVGLCGILSFSPAITSTTFGLGGSENGVTLMRFQPIFLLWLVIYFVVSGRYFVGIASRKYWVEVKKKSRRL
jgi:hypothetical protein